MFTRCRQEMPAKTFTTENKGNVRWNIWLNFVQHRQTWWPKEFKMLHATTEHKSMFIDRKSCIQLNSELWRHNCYKISLSWTNKFLPSFLRFKTLFSSSPPWKQQWRVEKWWCTLPGSLRDCRNWSTSLSESCGSASESSAPDWPRLA